MYLLIAQEYLELLNAQPARQGELFGTSSDGGAVVRLFSPRPAQTHGQLLGYWRKAGGQPFPTTQPGQLLLDLGQAEPQVYQVDTHGQTVEQAYELVNLGRDYHSRLGDLVDKNALANKKVLVAGLGSGGSAIASELAKAGVGQFVLVDFDRLKVHNLVRHICGFDDLGRFKTQAVRDYLYNTSLVSQVDTYELDVTHDSQEVAALLAGCDLVIGATDKEAAKSVLNEMAWKQQIPAIYGAAYDRGFGGDIFVAMPPAGACYECFRRNTAEFFTDDENRPAVNYGEDFFMPAMGMDVRMVALLTARVALTTLLRNDPTSRLEGYGANWTLWCNQPQPGFDLFDTLFSGPLQGTSIEISSDPLCPVCHPEANAQATIGMSLEEAQAQAAKLLDSIPTAPLDKIVS